MNRTTLIGAVTCAAAGAAALLAAAPAQAAPSVQALTCDGQQLLIRTNNNNSSDMGGWSAAQVVSGGSGTLIPTTFEFSAYDVTVGQTIFQGEQIKGGGNANHNQATVTCTQSETDTLGDLLEPGEQPPPGTSVDDEVTITLTATAVWQQ
jgi:hypothetical protein